MEIIEKTTNPMAERPLIQSLLLTCGITGSLVFTGLYIIEASLTPGYSSMKQAISDLELVKNGWMQSANFILMGIFVCLFGIGLRMELKKGVAAISLPVFQFLVALGLILSGIIIHDPFHTFASMISFISLVISFFLFAQRFRGDYRWKGWVAYSIVSGLLMMAFLALFGISKSMGGPAGLFERLVVAVRSVWSLIFTIRLLKGTRLTPLAPEKKMIYKAK